METSDQLTKRVEDEVLRILPGLLTEDSGLDGERFAFALWPKSGVLSVDRLFEKGVGLLSNTVLA